MGDGGERRGGVHGRGSGVGQGRHNWHILIGTRRLGAYVEGGLHAGREDGPVKLVTVRVRAVRVDDVGGTGHGHNQSEHNLKPHNTGYTTQSETLQHGLYTAT